MVIAHICRERIVELGLDFWISDPLHQAIHHQIVRLDNRGVYDGSELLLGVWVHLQLARGESSARVPLMLRAAGLCSTWALFLRSTAHVVCPPRILIGA